MGTYISQTDIENVYGTDNVAAWSDLTGGDTANTTRIASAISYAEGFVENYFRVSRYQVPFVQLSGAYDVVLVDWMAVLAGDWLYRSREVRRKTDTPGRTSANVERVKEEMSDTLALKVGLNVGLRADPMPTAPACRF